MKKSSHMLSLVLMGCSISLLVVLQVFWVHNAYEKAFFDFRRETTMIFGNTIADMRVAYLLKNVITISSDSMPEPARDTIMARRRLFGIASTQQRMRQADTVIVSVHDSIAVHREAFVENLSMQHGKSRHRMMLRFPADMIPVDSLKRAYREALHTAGIDAPFVVNALDAHVPDTELDPAGIFLLKNKNGMPPRNDRHLNDRVNVYADTATTDVMPFDPMHRFSASFPGVRTLLLQKITPEILFSLFVTAITMLAFGLMYRSIRAQQRLMVLKNDFISNITHELKTPVATVSVALEALKDFQGKNNPRLMEEYLAIAQGELNRLSLMTDKILKTSAWESQGVTFVAEKTDLDVIVQRVLLSMKLLFEKRQAQVLYEKEGENLYVAGSPMHLANVVYNLIDNALKYSPGKPSLLIKLTQRNGNVLLTLKDEGIGIAPEYQERIFDKFFRVPTGDIHNTKGYGLGLNYVANVVQRHRGKIDVDSAEGKGSLFTIVLPAFA